MYLILLSFRFLLVNKITGNKKITTFYLILPSRVQSPSETLPHYI